MYFENSITINRSIEDVFAYLSVHENHQAFVPQNKESRQLTDGPMGVGTRVQNIASFCGIRMKETFEVTEFVPNRLIAKRSEKESTIETSDRLELTALSEGETKVTLIVTGSPKGFHKVALGLLGPMLKRTFPRILHTLKDVLEAKR